MGNRPSAPAAAAAPPPSSASRPVPTALLHGCATPEEHADRVRRLLDAARGLEGDEGLAAMGFAFRFVPCPAHGDGEAPQSPDDDRPEPPRMRKSTSMDDRFVGHCHGCAMRLFCVGLPQGSAEAAPPEAAPPEGQSSEERHDEEGGAPEKEMGHSTDDAEASATGDTSEEAAMITPTNRQHYIADGHMYERVANLAQEAAQSRMRKTFDLEWVTVCNDETLGEKVRALVDRDHHLLLDEGENRIVLHELLLGKRSNNAGHGAPDEKKEDAAAIHRPTSPNRTKSTLLVATGRGKVRAGVFSRFHLLTAGIEVGTAWHCVREARMRQWGVAIVDPNARGEGVGYESFRRSVSQLFVGPEEGRDGGAGGEEEEGSTNAPSLEADTAPISNAPPMARQSSRTSLASDGTSHSIYILAHSASGGQLVRHLREDPTLLPSIRAVAFTDSTHNVQWAKHDPSLKEFLQTKNCVYLRSNDVRSSQSCVRVSSRGKDIWCDCPTCADKTKRAGAEADTDHFWEHRFGRVKTLWAGTADHALTNWAGHDTIWDHFDEHAGDDDGEAGNDDNDGAGLASS